MERSCFNKNVNLASENWSKVDSEGHMQTPGITYNKSRWTRNIMKWKVCKAPIWGPFSTWAALVFMPHMTILWGCLSLPLIFPDHSLSLPSQRLLPNCPYALSASPYLPCSTQKWPICVRASHLPLLQSRQTGCCHGNSVSKGTREAASQRPYFVNSLWLCQFGPRREKQQLGISI